MRLIFERAEKQFKKDKNKKEDRSKIIDYWLKCE